MVSRYMGTYFPLSPPFFYLDIATAAKVEMAEFRSLWGGPVNKKALAEFSMVCIAHFSTMLLMQYVCSIFIR